MTFLKQLVMSSLGIKDKKPLELAIIKGKGWALFGQSHYDKNMVPVKKVFFLVYFKRH